MNLFMKEFPESASFVLVFEDDGRLINYWQGEEDRIKHYRKAVMTSKTIRKQGFKQIRPDDIKDDNEFYITEVLHKFYKPVMKKHSWKVKEFYMDYMRHLYDRNVKTGKGVVISIDEKDYVKDVYGLVGVEKDITYLMLDHKYEKQLWQIRLLIDNMYGIKKWIKPEYVRTINV